MNSKDNVKKGRFFVLKRYKRNLLKFKEKTLIMIGKIIRNP